MRRYISEDIDSMDFQYGQFNLIVSGTGTGKTEFIRRGLLSRFPYVSPEEILYVTSRSMIRDQQSTMDGISRVDHSNAVGVVKYWNGDAATMIDHDGIWIMNYAQLVHVFEDMNPEHGRTLTNIKIVVFDECHAIYSDYFIDGILAIRVWLRERIVNRDAICIGLTATPDIVYHCAKKTGIKPVQVNKEKIVNYKAKNLICTRLESVADLINSGKFPGGTIIMCSSIRDGEAMMAKIPNSTLICSANNKRFNSRMAEIRDYIIDHGRLPEFTDRGEPLRVLITTSTMREGVNLNPGCGIRNVVCCLSDELHVKQFVGRCRFDVENLIVAHRSRVVDNQSKDSYLVQSRIAFEEFLRDESKRGWFDSISDIFDGSIDDVIRIDVGEKPEDFCRMIDRTWACPEDATEEDQQARMIYKETDKQSIVDYAFRCGLIEKYKSQYSLGMVLKYLEENYGYRIETGRVRIDGVRYTYKIIFERNSKDERDE